MPLSDHIATSYSSSGNEGWLTTLRLSSGTTVAALDAAVRDSARQPTSSGTRFKVGSWKVGTYVDSGENAEINTYARKEVELGAEALLFRLYHQPDADEIASILKDISIEDHSLHCTLRYPGQDPAELFRDLVRYLRRKGYQLDTITGSVDFDPLLDWSEPPFPPLIRLLYFVSRWMPRFRVLQVNAAGFNDGIEGADAELALAISKGAAYLKQIEKLDYPAALANNHLQFAFTVGSSFYGDVAKLRALRVLWKRVLQHLGINGEPSIEVAAHSDIAVIGGETEDTGLQLRLQALAAAAGGADMVFLAPAEGPFLPATDDGRRNALQTQLDVRSGALSLSEQDVDQSALQTITDALVEAAWQRYQTIEAQGGFANAIEF